MVKRIKASKGYTKEIGTALGIVETKQKPSPDSITATLNAIPAKSGYMAAVVIGNRHDSDMWKIFARRAGSEKREEVAGGTGKSADIEIVPTTDGQPEKVGLTAQLYKKNEPYGQPSDTVYVTVSP